jgi:hypothetical protein
MIKGSFKDRTGEKYITNEGCEVEIIQCSHSGNCTVKFLDTHYIKYNVDFADIKRGEIKNPHHPSLLGIGFIGEGFYKTKHNYKMTPYYKRWVGMLKRCYSEEYQQKYPTYKGCAVVEEWHNFQNFAKWFEDNWKDYMDSWDLDKDILVKGNKVYSPKTCCFVPSIINSLILKTKKARGEYPIGVHKSGNKFVATMAKKKIGSFDTPEEAFQAYKTAKEQYIKEMAEKWKHLICKQVYQAMYNYKVEIDD